MEAKNYGYKKAPIQGEITRKASRPTIKTEYGDLRTENAEHFRSPSDFQRVLSKNELTETEA